jgi:hypothetical protein
VAIESSSVLVNSPVSIIVGSLSVSQCELQSDGASVPLTVELGGSVVVTSAIFQLWQRWWAPVAWCTVELS